MNHFIKTRILPYLLYIFYRLYIFTVRYKEPSMPKGIKKDQNYIVAHFHQDELVLVKTRINSNFCVMTSTSSDGEMMTRFLDLLGYTCVRGSTTRGGSKALIEMIHAIKMCNLNAVLAVDGPRGPIYKVKKGAVMLAKQTGFPILPVGVKISRSFCFSKSWNKALLPKPFSKVNILFGEVINVPQKGNEEKMEELALKLEKTLLSIKGL